ncbi:MAG: hypothetical protein Ct9H300mP4_13020 [Gammaproteobacteria bacterium]|nr:MAG: hypothetical protein Ct9H300mP4_13020 [Gammaproteobacteria bacterium]
MEGTDICFAPVLNMAEAPEPPTQQSKRYIYRIGRNCSASPSPKILKNTPEANPPLLLWGTYGRSFEKHRHAGFGY